MESTPEVDSGKSLAKNQISAEAIQVGSELHVDIWLKAVTTHPQSILIRSTDINGEMRSAFFHIDKEVREVPIINDRPGDITREIKVDRKAISRKPTREFTWSPDKVRTKKRPGKIALEISSLLLTISLFTAMIVGALQLRVVLTGSMRPTINPGDMVVAISPKYFEPQKGRVALYVARDLQGKAVTTWAHRIVGGDAIFGFEFKGDANAQPDLGRPKLSDIKGVVLFTIPKLGRIFSPIPLILIVSGVFIMFSVLRRNEEA